MIHIADTKVARRYGDYFLRQIHKLQDVGLHVLHVNFYWNMILLLDCSLKVVFRFLIRCVSPKLIQINKDLL